MFEVLEKGISRLRVPYGNIYTSVFLLEEDGECFLVDGGASPEDAEKYLLPALKERGIRPSLIVRSHCHGDHSGGVERIAQEYGIKIALMEDAPDDGRFLRLYDGDVLFKRFQTLHLKGHTEECLGLLDLRTNTLLSFDGLQGEGNDKYGVSFTCVEEYLRSVDRVRGLRVQRIIASHDFAPCGFDVRGREDIASYLDGCEKKARGK